MYAKFINDKEFEIIVRPNWFMDDGSPVTDEILKLEGILPIIDDYPEDVDPITQIVNENAQSQWIINEDNVTKTYTVTNLTIEEQRAIMPPISKRQLRLTLVRNGFSLSALDDAIAGMGDEAVIEWQDASEYRRLHPLLNQVAAHLSLTQEQVDAMWQEALEA